jgi:lipoprotein-releasing system permease protein
MNYEFFIARRIYFQGETKGKAANPAIRIATLGMCLGLVIMILSLCIVLGFKREVRSKVVGIGSHIQISNFRSSSSYETFPVQAGDSLAQLLNAEPDITHWQRYATKPGMIKTDDNFQGMVLKGVAQEYDWSFLQQHLVEGEIPVFTDSVSSNRVLISQTLANKLDIHLGDLIYTYYIEGEVRARRLEVAGIYETHFSEFDRLFLLTDLRTVVRLNRWEPDQVSGVEVNLKEEAPLDDTANRLARRMDLLVDNYGGTYYVQTVEDLNPQLFAWLGVLDMNVWVILVLMLGVAGFSMISGLLILILERTNMIGILKAMGGTNRSIRKIFLYFAAFIIGRAMFWGNVIGLALCFLQSKFQLVKLNPADYYLDAVPIYFNGWVWLALNVATLLVTLLILVGPSYLISRIHPAQSIRFE